MAKTAARSKRSEKYITERISKAGAHSFEICIRMYDQTFRKSIKIDDFESRKQALQFACQLRDETLLKMRSGYSVSNFKKVSSLYEKTFDLFPVRQKTRKKHDYFYKYGIERYGDKTIDKITSANIQESINTYARTHTKRQVAGLLAVWRRIYKACAMQNINVIDRTVAVIIPECRQGKHRKKEISEEDLQTFCNTLLCYNSSSPSGSYRSKAVYYAIQIMYYCGLRPAETFALMKSDIHLDEGFISISKAAHSTVESILEIGAPKTQQSIRNVPIPDQLKPILEECVNWSLNNILLSDRAGKLMDIDDIDTLVGNVAKKAKVTFTLYMLRHQFSTDLHNAGTNPAVIRDLMGHESATMSLDYAVSDEKDRIKAINQRNAEKYE